MKTEYETIIKDVCRLDNWRHARRNERDGAIGIACMLSFLRGTNPNVTEMARDIGVSPDELKVPFKRLLVNGIFSGRYGAKEDSVLLGKAKFTYLGDSGIAYTASDQTRNAWCTIAGISSGDCGLRENY